MRTVIRVIRVFHVYSNNLAIAVYFYTQHYFQPSKTYVSQHNIYADSYDYDNWCEQLSNW